MQSVTLQSFVIQILDSLAEWFCVHPSEDNDRLALFIYNNALPLKSSYNLYVISKQWKGFNGELRHADI